MPRKNVFSRVKDAIFNPNKKANVGATQELTKQGLVKSYIPKFLYKPPFGYPRYTDLANVRRLSDQPFVEMCISTIIDEMCAVDWEIIQENESPEVEEDPKVDDVREFFENPNSNKATFRKIRRKYLRDILEVDAGVLNKVYNKKGELVELYARDGATFTKNPDIHGTFADREDYIDVQLVDNFAGQNQQDKPRNVSKQVVGTQTDIRVRNRAAYFQYGWVTGARPVPFGLKEIVWMERNPRTDSVYGQSPVEILVEAIQTLIYSIESNLEYYNDNNIPKGILGLEGADSDEIAEFQEKWKEQQKTKDKVGKWKKALHKMPIVGHMPDFKRIQFSNAELQLIEQQKWFSKMIWAAFGVTASELGYTENSNRATEIIQSSVFRRKAINPLLRMEEERINREIIPDLEARFGVENIEFKFNTFDIANEQKKAELYEKWVNNGIYTINEVRQREGLEEVEWGDKPPKDWQKSESSFNFSQLNQNPEDEEEQEEEEEEEKSVETKPFADYSSFQDCVNKNSDKEDPEAYCAQIEKEATGEYPGKALATTQNGNKNPLVLGENEKPTMRKLQRAIKYILDNHEDKLEKLIEKESGKQVLEEIDLTEQKSITELADKVKGMLSFNSIKDLAKQVIGHQYNEGHEQVEKKLGRNLSPDKQVKQFINEYTF